MRNGFVHGQAGRSLPEIDLVPARMLTRRNQRRDDQVRGEHDVELALDIADTLVP